jgi:hypothetical protein
MITNKEVRISVNRTLTKKLIYVIAVVAMLAMMIPATAVPAFAADSTLPAANMILINPLDHTVGMADAGYNVRGSIVQITANTASTTVSSWTLSPNNTGTQIITPNVGTLPNPNNISPAPTTSNSVWVYGYVGDFTITANMVNGDTQHIDKKFSTVINTVLTPASGGNVVTWNEQAKTWSGTATFTDVVTGNYTGPVPAHTEEGVILNWYLLVGNVAPPAPGEAQTLNAAMLAMITPTPTDHVNFSNGLHFIQTISDSNGSSTVTITATGEEAVTIIIIPQYIGDPQVNVVPEVATWDFYTTELDVVPQVRWAGEKIVLEKNFGDGTNAPFPGAWVKFSLQNQSVGSLEAVAGTTSTLNAGVVWTQLSTTGFASCILTSSDVGVSQVTAALYSGVDVGPLQNQHYFTVYWLKMESLKLGDVNGKRVNHDSGLWTLPNPWDVTTDTTTQTLNVSSDALMRANVKGWFTSSNPSARPVRYIDPTNTTVDPTPTNGVYPANTLMLPAGRWILPDDWAALAGPNWQMSRLHWDIMNDPYGILTG